MTYQTSYHVRPVPVLAEQFISKNQLPEGVHNAELESATVFLLRSAYGPLIVGLGDWIVTWPDGKQTVYSDKEFNKRFEPTME